MHNKIHSQILTAQVNGLLPHTAYQIAQMIGAETDPDNTEFNRIKTRWQRWLSGEGLNSVEALASDLDALELEVIIRRKKGNE